MPAAAHHFQRMESRIERCLKSARLLLLEGGIWLGVGGALLMLALRNPEGKLPYLIMSALLLLLALGKYQHYRTVCMFRRYLRKRGDDRA